MFRALISLVAVLFMSATASAKTALDVREDLEQSVFYVSPTYPPIVTGTAFTVQAPSGKSYTLTNHHVCFGSTDGYLYFIDQATDKLITKRKILRQYNDHDLCLAEGVKSSPAISIADQAFLEHVTTLGYPLGQPLTSVSGDIVGSENIQVAYDDSPDECQHWRNHKIEPRTLEITPRFSITVPGCVFSGPAIATTIVSGPGASGSPVVNQDEELVGVVFAYSTVVPWLKLVPLEYVKAFLKNR